MYKHDSDEYLPQHPMLVQIREEKELYNSLPESMKLGAENFMDVEELSSASEHFSDEEMDFSDEEVNYLDFEPAAWGRSKCGKGKKKANKKQWKWAWLYGIFGKRFALNKAKYKAAGKLKPKGTLSYSKVSRFIIDIKTDQLNDGDSLMAQSKLTTNSSVADIVAQANKTFSQAKCTY